MTAIPEAGRQAAHVLLDAVSAFELGAADETNAAALNLALTRLHEIGVVTATLRDDDALDVSVSDLVGGALLVMVWLARQVELSAEVDKFEVISRAREFIDEPEQSSHG